MHFHPAAAAIRLTQACIALCPCHPRRCRFQAVDARAPAATRGVLQQEALDEMRRAVEELAQAVGHGHMLVQGATRYYGKLIKLLGQ